MDDNRSTLRQFGFLQPTPDATRSATSRRSCAGRPGSGAGRSWKNWGL